MDTNHLFQKFVAFTASVHQLKHEMTKDLRTGDISPVQYDILEYIAVSQPVTLSEISDCQHLSMPNASRELKKLTEKNLCEKFAASEDRRKQYIRLSNKGEAMMNKVFETVQARFLERINQASKEDLKEIDHALDVLQSKVFYS